MKETILTEATKRVVEMAVKTAEMFVEEHVEPLENVGSPEKLLGKKYEEWQEPDIWLLSQVYGNKLTDFMVKKEYKAVKELEEGL